MSQRNKDLPAMPVHPMQDKFGQVILMAGMTKLEITALNILCSQLRINFEDISDSDILHKIEMAYTYAEQFCSFLEQNNDEKSSIII